MATDLLDLQRDVSTCFTYVAHAPRPTEPNVLCLSCDDQLMLIVCHRLPVSLVGLPAAGQWVRPDTTLQQCLRAAAAWELVDDVECIRRALAKLHGGEHTLYDGMSTLSNEIMQFAVHRMRSHLRSALCETEMHRTLLCQHSQLRIESVTPVPATTQQ